MSMKETVQSRHRDYSENGERSEPSQMGRGQGNGARVAAEAIIHVCSITHNSQGMETSLVSVKRCMDQENMVYITHNGILFSF